MSMSILVVAFVVVLGTYLYVRSRRLSKAARKK